MKKTKQYEELAVKINRYGGDLAGCVREVFGKKADAFAAALILQMARMNGNVHTDYDRRTYGYLNPENVCSVAADLRNDQAIRKCTELLSTRANRYVMEKLAGSEDLAEIPYKSLYVPSKKELQETLRLCVTELHKTLQQSLAGACIQVMKDDRIVAETFNARMFMI